MHQDVGIGQHLIVYDGVVAHVVVVDKGDGVPGAVRYDRNAVRQLAQIIVEGVADIFQFVAQREIEGAIWLSEKPLTLVSHCSMSSPPSQYSPTTKGLNSLPSLT